MQPPSTADHHAASATTRIVGIGASAGGLAALEQFLGKTPPHTGMAYIVVQHLDPTQKALLPELLQRITEMPVREAEQDMVISPDFVYVIPPNTELSVVDDTLRLAAPAKPRGMRLPINVLFSSLASALGDRAIAVILSGMGSDGTLGLQAIKAVGGLTVVQDPASAQFDSMPNSAIDTASPDIVGPADELPDRILTYVARLQDSSITADAQAATPTPPLQRIFALLQGQTRHDFSFYKPNTLHRRIGRRMAIHGIATLALYADFLDNNPQETDLLFKELLIGVTSFFRDPAVWEYLADVTLPELLAQQRQEQKLRAWSIGCSTGEEAYSLAMVFSDALERLPGPRDISLQIFASDLSPDAIAFARRGHYPQAISADISPERLARYFTAIETGYQINANIRDMVLFAKHDVVLDPPFTRLDLIVCRNLLIYFSPMLQRRLLPLFHYSLRQGGVLLLGSSETVGRYSDLFTPIESRLRLYLRQNFMSSGVTDFPVKSFPPLTSMIKEHAMTPPETPPAPSGDKLQSMVDHVLLQGYAPAAVLLNNEGDIVYISGHTGKYLEPAAGKANLNIHAMMREGLRAPISEALKQATAQKEPIQLHGLHIEAPAGTQVVDVTVQAFQEPAALQGMTLIVFHDVPPAPPARGRRKSRSVTQASHEAETQQYQDEIRILREEARASREELQSSNEELQSTNEELQSANEELTTSKEEMQSMNEELQTINSELQTKLDDLSLAQSDMQNVLNSIEIAILFLDQKLNVRRFTDRVSKIISLRESDIGRPLSDLTSQLDYPSMYEDAIETLRTLKPVEKEILSSDGRWFAVRIMPYRRLDDMIDGVVITLVDITATKKLEAKLRKESKV